MPSKDLLLYFQKDLYLKKHWAVNGQHYGKTAKEWLKVLDKNKKASLPILAQTYGMN